MDDKPFNVMIDLETLDTRASAMIVQIGAVVDDTRYKIISRLQVEVSVRDNISHGRTVSDSALARWEEKNPALLESFHGYTTPLVDALQQLTDFIPPKARIWANAPTFDLAILHSAYAGCGMKAPWGYWQECCYRTMRIVHGDKVQGLEDNGHIAVEDASCQMRNLGKMMAAVEANNAN